MQFVYDGTPHTARSVNTVVGFFFTQASLQDTWSNNPLFSSEVALMYGLFIVLSKWLHQVLLGWISQTQICGRIQWSVYKLHTCICGEK